jgi:hypothetical protein
MAGHDGVGRVDELIFPKNNFDLFSAAVANSSLVQEAIDRLRIRHARLLNNFLHGGAAAVDRLFVWIRYLGVIDSRGAARGFVARS